MSDVQAMFDATLAIFKLEFAIYGFTFSFWNVLLFAIFGSMIMYFIGGLFR